MSKRLKGQGWQIEEMIKVIAVMVIFAGAVLIIIAATGGLNGVLQEFCLKNPSWCGEPDTCVCCEVITSAKTGWPFQDIYSREYLWTNEKDCVALLKDNDGAMYWKGDSNLVRCGTIPNATLTSSGVIFHDTCAVPPQYVSESLIPCICCSYEPSPGVITTTWDIRWRCMERTNFNITDSDTCGPLWLMPPESQEKTLQRIGKLYGLGGQYCAIPYPYNLTVAP